MKTQKQNLQPWHQRVFFNDVATHYTAEALDELVASYEQKRLVNIEKEVVKAVVIAITDKEVMLELQTKADGIVPKSEFKDLPNLQIGDEVEVYIERQENMQGELVVSRKSAKLIRAWQALQQAHKEGKVVQGVVKRKIKGGLVLDTLGIEVFLPGSQINTVQTLDFDEYVGRTLEVLVTKINEQKHNIVVSRKALIEKEQIKQREAIIKSLEKGQVLSGIIKNITKFGLFINLGSESGVVGLLHKKDIASSKKIDDPSHVMDDQGKPRFQVGGSIDVVIKDFDLEKSYISLSTKMLTWAKLPEDIVEGSRVKGIVKEMTDYYALVEIIEGVVGLLHISEMSHSNFVKHPQDLISLDQELDLQVIDIDREAQELRLGMKQLTQDPWESDAISTYVIGNRYKAAIRTITKNGMYLELEPGIEGFLHKKYMSWTQKVQDIDRQYSEKDQLEVMVLDIDSKNKLILLTLRDLAENPWPSFKKEFTIGSVHKTMIVKKTNGGIIIETEQGLQSFVPNKDVGKQDLKKLTIGSTLDLYVVDFLEEEHKVVFSRIQQEQKSTATKSTYKNVEINNTLGDIEVLKQLKAELAEKEKQEKSSKKKK